MSPTVIIYKKLLQKMRKSWNLERSTNKLKSIF